MKFEGDTLPTFSLLGGGRKSWYIIIIEKFLIGEVSV